MFIAPPTPTQVTANFYDGLKASQGYVMNLTRAWAWRPDVFTAFADLRARLTNASELSERERAVMVCAAASQLGDAYCSLAWGGTLANLVGGKAAAAMIADMPDSSFSVRELALAQWARKVVTNPNETCPSDVDALRDAGLCDQQIFEATAFIALRLAFSTINDALGIAPDRQLTAQAPLEVQEAVVFGRRASAA